MNKVDWINEKQNLENLINKGIAYTEIGRMYGVTIGAVKKAAKKLGINLAPRRKINASEHFNKGCGDTHYCLFCGAIIKQIRRYDNTFCSKDCQANYYRRLYLERWKRGEEDGLKGKYGLSSYIRVYLLEKHQYKCERCGWGEKNEFTGKVPLEIHHIDGDYRNNKEENLQVLCPNCHSLTETYKSHNKSGRKGREKYY